MDQVAGPPLRIHGVFHGDGDRGFYGRTRAGQLFHRQTERVERSPGARICVAGVGSRTDWGVVAGGSGAGSRVLPSSASLYGGVAIFAARVSSAGSHAGTGESDVFDGRNIFGADAGRRAATARAGATRGADVCGEYAWRCLRDFS